MCSQKYYGKIGVAISRYQLKEVDKIKRVMSSMRSMKKIIIKKRMLVPDVRFGFDMFTNTSVEVECGSRQNSAWVDTGLPSALTTTHCYTSDVLLYASFALLHTHTLTL